MTEKGTDMKNEFCYQGKKYPYTIVRSKRKTVAISVSEEKGIVVKLPDFFPMRELDKMILQKADWIAEKYEEAAVKQKVKPVHEFCSGEEFYYRGKALILNLIVNADRKRIMVRKQAGKLLVVSPAADREVIRDAIIKWYREQARELLTDKVSYYRQFINKPIGEIRIKEQKSRWGSCSARGNLNFNWKIIMAPDEIIDYLVVHELCHLLHMNHSKEFWQSVGSILPDYKSRKSWLKENGVLLNL